MGTKLLLGFISVIIIAALILIFSESGFAQPQKSVVGGYVEGGVAGIDFIKKFDFDKDGKVSHDEWEGIKPTTAYRDKHWPQYDLNRDGFITLDEAPQEKAKSSEIKHSFNANQIAFIVKFDKNEDGKLDNTEFTGSHFPVYDKNGDGFIEAHEAPEGKTAY
ncbi:hypothetical protein ACFL0H_11835 [Thermodesulfobacteriota bacterium]